MRAGEVYKIQGMLKEGKSESEICDYFSNKYSSEKVKEFLPKPKKKVVKKKAAKTTPEVETDGNSSVDSEPSTGVVGGETDNQL